MILLIHDLFQLLLCRFPAFLSSFLFFLHLFQLFLEGFDLLPTLFILFQMLNLLRCVSGFEILSCSRAGGTQLILLRSEL